MRQYYHLLCTISTHAVVGWRDLVLKAAASCALILNRHQIHPHKKGVPQLLRYILNRSDPKRPLHGPRLRLDSTTNHILRHSQPFLPQPTLKMRNTRHNSNRSVQAFSFDSLGCAAECYGAAMNARMALTRLRARRAQTVSGLQGNIATREL